MMLSSNIKFLCTLQKSAVAAGKAAAAAGGTTGRRKSLKKKVGQRNVPFTFQSHSPTFVSYLVL